MARFTPSPGLDIEVARRFVTPRVQQIVRDVTVEAVRRAPAGQVWVTMRDERVRPSHVHADDQLIPANLRYEVGEPGGPVTLMRGPRDPNAPARERANCRCTSVRVPGAVGQRVRGEQTIASGTRVVGRVVCEFNRIVESHNAQAPDNSIPFMADALEAVAARYRGAGARRT